MNTQENDRIVDKDSKHEWLRRLTTFVLVLTVLLAAFLPILAQLIHLVIVPDFTNLWAGGRFAVHSPSLLYDVDALTAAQQELRGAAKKGPLPWIYPPTTLLLVVPFSLLPFWPAFYVWTFAGALAFWSAARRLTSGWVAMLAILSPPGMTVLILGQTTFFVGAAILWSIALLRHRPMLSGVLMGVAAAIKPQCAIMAPVAYLSIRSWKALVTSGLTWLLLAAISLSFGPTLWLDWLNALPEFPQMIAVWNLDRHGATPTMMARFYGLNPLPFLFGGVILGVAAVWIGSRSNDVHTRALTFVVGTLLASPYAMNYELTLAAPMLLTAMLSTTLTGLIVAAPLLAARAYAIAPALAVSAALALWQARKAGQLSGPAD